MGVSGSLPDLPDSTQPGGAGAGHWHRRPGRCRHSATEGLAISESGIEPTKDAAAFKLPLCTQCHSLQLPAAAPRRGALADPEIPESRPAPPRFGRENSRDFPDPDWAGIGKILGILPRSRFGRDPGRACPLSHGVPSRSTAGRGWYWHPGGRPLADTAPWYYHDVKCERASTL
jgi:hypothetical protein